MRDYTYLNGARFSINNLFRSLRFDIDRLDMSWVDSEKPAFSRGLRIVDNDESNTVTVDGEDADNLIYSLYNQIFSEKYPETLFISSGGNTELDHRSEVAIKILTKVFAEVEILLLKDRDFLSGSQASIEDRRVYLEKNEPHHKVLLRFEIENYLLDKSVLRKYCDINKFLFPEDKYNELVIDIDNQNVKDMLEKFKELCGVDGNYSNDRFLIGLAECITQDMSIYTELEKCIF